VRYIFAAVLVGSAAACGGYNMSGPMGPSASTPPPSNTIVIDVVGINGTQSFRPNPSTVPPGQLVVWHNVDSVPHRVVFDDGEVDSGNLAAGAFSVPTELGAAGPYHCSIHPEMIGRTVDGK
jgi:plastocyanin